MKNQKFEEKKRILMPFVKKNQSNDTKKFKNKNLFYDVSLSHLIFY